MTEVSNIKEFDLEWVNRPSVDGTRTGYWRKVPRTRADPTIAQAEARLAFSKVATQTFGVKGTAELNGREIPTNARIIMEETAGSHFKTQDERKFDKLSKWEKVMLLLSRT